MSPTLRKAVQNVFVILLVGGAGTGAVYAWKRYGAVDPYKAIKKPPVNNGSAFTATGVKVRQYTNGKLVAGATAQSMNMAADRSSLNLEKVTDGSMRTDKGNVGFEAGAGVLRPNLKMVDVSKGVHLYGARFDLKTDQATIDGKTSQINMPKPLSGQIDKNPFRGENLVYVANSEYLKVNKVAARVKVPKEAGLMPSMQGRAWDIATEEMVSDPKTKGFRSYTDARAEDGEVIVMAPKVVEEIKTGILTATGRATYRSAKADIVADKVVVDRKKKIAYFTGNVVTYVRAKKDWNKPLPKNDDGGSKPLVPKVPDDLKVKGAPAEDHISAKERERDKELRSGKTLREYPMTLKAEEVTYWYKEGERHAIAKGGDPTAYQAFDDGRWRETKAFEARYDGEKDLLDLYSDGAKIGVKYKNSIGDWGNSNYLQISTKEDQPDDDEGTGILRSLKANIHYIDKDGDDDPRGAAKADDKKAPPPTKTEPPVKTGP